MTARTLLDEGKLGEAIAAQTQEVKSAPSDLSARTFLFELLAHASEWDRATRQLDAIAHLLTADPASQVGVAVYRRLVDAETRRAKLFAEGVRPRFVLEPPSEVNFHLEALDLLRESKADQARDRLDRASEARLPLAGTLAGSLFGDFRDADDLLAPVLEVFAPAGYCWIPWSQVQFLEVVPPRSFRDLLWTPARLATFDGQLGEVHLPALYPGSASHPDDGARLGRLTDWIELDGGIVRGAGLKTFLAGDEPRTLFELTDLRFAPPSGGSTSEDAPSP